ncbi:MAG TPA: septal ring lytic transglycosylase RlpA family protein [Solirubrobacteraceae bacterium]|nr:septal ring lytic transglycosylase RlpA family protein [Solirubrobacteraceae bacterium]
MAESRRLRRAAVAIVVALACAASLSACGKSAPAPRLANSPTAPSPDPPARSSGAGTQALANTTSTTGAAAPQPNGAGAARAAVAPAHPVPAAFRPAPGAPSDAEVRSELAKMSAIRRREDRLRLSAAAANLAGLLPWTLEPKSGVQVSVASVFTDYGLGLACGGVLGRSQLGVAHKTAPCGTLITFGYGGRVLTVPVIDRGPYIAGREWDLTGATAAALGFPGLGKIEWSLAR